MAGEATIGALRVVLGADTAKFEDNLNKAGKSLDSFGKRVAAVATGIGLATVVERVASSLSHAFKKAIGDAFEFADSMGKMAQKVGISVEELTGLKLAADLADVNIETFSKSLGILSKNMVAAASGNKELSDKFNQLGIDVRDGERNIKSVTQVLIEMADKFEGTKDGAVKVEAALKLLGRGGKDLIPLLNEGGSSLREFAEIAERMGLVISTKTSAQTQKFNDDLKLLKFAMEGIANLVLKDLITGLSNMSGEMAKTIKSGEGIRTTAKGISDAFKEIFVQVIITIETFKLLAEILPIIGNSFKIGMGEIVEETKKLSAPVTEYANNWTQKKVLVLQSIAEFLKAFVTLREEGKRLSQDEALAFGDRIVKTIPPANAELLKIVDVLARLAGLDASVRSLLIKTMQEGKEAVKRAGEAIDDPLNKNMEKLNDHIKHLRMQALDTSGVFSGQLAQGFLGAASGMEALKGQITIVRDRMVLLGPEAQKLNIEMAKLEAFKLNAENLAPLDLLAQKLDHINFLQKEAGLSAQAAAILQVKAAGDVLLAYGQAAQNIVGGFASAFKDLASMNKKYAGAAKALALAEALVQTYLGAIKAYTSTVSVLGPIGAAVAAAAATAAGLANVAKISATQFAQGGSFKVGGVGGTDSQLVNFMATPGEMVDVRKPGAETNISEITVNMRGRDIFTGDAIRDLFTAINQGTSDGYRLKVV